MADAKCTNSLPIHEKQDLHKEISSSPKVPPRNKRRENISDDNDGQDKEGIKSKNSAQSAKPSPSKPSLPPRPAGLTLLRTPPKTSPNKPVHPPPPHKNQPPKPAPLKSSNEIPGLAKPHRPPQPSRQPSIKTASAPGRPKPPEIARSAPETPKSPVSISVSKVVKDANLKPKKPKPPEVSRTSGVVRATTLAPGKPNLSEASESSEAVKESTVAPDKAKPPEISRTSEVVKETTVTEDKSKPGEVPRTTSVSDKPKSVEEEKQSNEDKAPGHVPVKPKPPGAARTSEVVKAKTESLEIGRTSDVVKEKPIAQEKSESPELPKTSRDEEPIGRPQQKPKQTDGKLTEVVQETTPTREIPVPPEEMIISEPLTEKKESVQEQAEAVEAIARALVRQKLSEVSGTSTVGEGKVAPPEKPKPPKIPKSSEQVKEKRLAPEKPKSPEVTRSSGFANKTMPDTGRLKTVEVSQNSYVAKEKRTPPPKPKSPMVTRTSKIAQEIGKPKSAAVSGLSDKVKETRPAPPRQRSPEEASKTEEQKESEVGRVSEAVREKRRAPEKPKSPQVTRTAKDATSEPEKAKLAEVRKESDGIKEKRPAPEKPKSPETTRMTRVVEETAPVPVGTKSTEKSGTSVVMNETNSAQKPSTKKPDGKSLTEDKISENESHVCTDERILERNAHRRSLRCKPQRPPAPSSEVTTPTRVSIGVTMAIKETGKPDEHEPSVADDKKDVPNQKKLNRPPRPVAPHQSDVLPQHAKTAKNSETTGESQVTIVDDANQPDELPDEHEVTQQSDARQPDKSNKPLKPRRGSDIHDNASPRISRPSKPRRSESDVNACLTHTKGHPETGEETKARELPEASKVPKHVRPPPPKRTAAVKKINEKALNVADEEKPNESHNQLEKTVEQESEKKGDISNESDTGKEEPKIRFRVTSLTKTEVESFNMENFCVKSKNDERTSTKEEKKRNKPPPPLLPKPPRQRPPPPRLKKSSDKVEMEKKAEGKEWKVNERKTDGGSQVTLEEDDGRDELLNGKVVDENKAKETKMDKTKEKRVKRRAPEVPEDIQDKRGIEGKKDMKDKKNIEDNKDLTNEKAAAPKHSSIPGCGKGLRDTADTLIRNDDAKMTTTNVGVIEEQVRITVDLNDDSRKQDGGEREVLRKDSKVGEAVVASETMKVDDSMTEHPTDRGKQAKGNAVEERSLENTERDIEEKIEKRVSFTTENYLAPKEQVDQEMKEGKTNDVIIKRTFDVDKYLANEEPACDKGNVGKKSKDGLGEEDHLSKQEQELHAEGKKVDEEIADVQEDLSEQKDKGKTNYLRVQNGAEKNDQKRFRSMAKADLLEVRNAEDNRTGSSAEPLHEAVGKIPKEIDLGKEISEAKTEDQEGSILSTKTETVEDQKEVEEQQKNGICLEDDMNLEDSPSEIKTDTVCVENDREAVVVETEKNKDNSVTNDVPSMDSHTERNTCQGHVVVEGNAGDTQKQSGVSMDLKETRTVEDSPVVAAAQVVPVSDSVPLTEEKVGASFQDTGASRDDGLTSSEDANLLPEEISRTHSDSASPPEAENASHEDTCPTRESKDRVAKNEQVNIQEVTTSTSAVLEAKVTHVEISDQRPEESNVATALPRVQSPEKKMPPPKPKRTSSLKRDSQPLARMSSGSEEYLNQISEDNMSDTSRNCRESHNHVVANETASDTQDKHVVSSETRERNVAFPGDVVEVNESSVTVARSKSFSATGKNRTKSGTSGEKTTGTKDGSGTGAEGLARSLSFAGIKKMKKSQPPRPRPPTFFINESLPSDVTTGDVKKSDSVEELESAEESPKEESLSDNKHDSLTLENTTDSDSDREKVEVPQKSKTYYISKEILSTERTFVDAVKLVSEDFMKALEDGNNKFGRAVIPPETLHDILLNISQIYDFDREFLKALESRMETWDEQQRIGDIIKRFSPFLKMYKTYIQGYDNAMAVLSEALKKYPQFAEVVREFQFSERCQNLTVGMYMLKPIQRIPSYRLLLIDYLKHLAKDSLDYKDVSDALAIVSDVATHINEDMKRVDNFEEVLRVQRSLVGQVEIVKPGRELIKEGLLMKLCRKDMQPRMFYLFTDVLLYTTPVNNQFRMNLSLPLEEIKVEIPASSDFDNEFSIISTKKSFTLSASTPDERDEWLEALRNASDEIRKKKITFHLAKKERMEALLEAVQDGEDKNSKLGSKAPVWIPDARVTMCMVCTDDFTVTNRRHHCRACGKVICGSCSSNSVSLQYLNDETARVCDYCYDELSEPSAKPSTTAQENGDNKEITEALSNIPGKKSLNAEPANKNKKSKKFSKIKSKEVPEVKESVISGYLRTRIGKKWHKRWYLLKDNVLYTSKASSDVAAQETRPLLGYDIRGPEKMDGDSKKIVFQLIHAGTPPVVLQTDNIKSAEQWVNALRRATILPL